MKVAVVGSRNIVIELEKYLPENINLIISGGAIGVDACAEKYADTNGINKLIFLPDYKNNPSRIAPLIRNKLIVEHADTIYAFWDGKSRGTKFTIDYAKKLDKEVKIFLITK